MPDAKKGNLISARTAYLTAIDLSLLPCSPASELRTARPLWEYHYPCLKANKSPAGGNLGALPITHYDPHCSFVLSIRETMILYSATSLAHSVCKWNGVLSPAHANPLYYKDRRYFPRTFAHSLPPSALAHPFSSSSQGDRWGFFREPWWVRSWNGPNGC